MRQLGSFFHVAMSGMAASDRIFRLLDLPVEPQAGVEMPKDCSITCTGLRFSYEPGREILYGVRLQFPQGSFTVLVGESGRGGKSTVFSVLMERNRGMPVRLPSAE